MGWNGSEPSGKDSPIVKKAPSKFRGLTALAVVVLLGAGACFFILRPSDERRTDRPSQKPSTAVIPGDRKAEARVPRKTADVATQKRPSQTAPRAQQAVAETTVTVSVPIEATNAVPDRPKPTLETPTDELIALATTTEDGGLVPPLPELSKSDTQKFLESYRKPIPIDDKDTDQVKALKQHVNAVREQIAGLIAQDPDRSLSEILNEHREAVNANSELYAEAKKEYDALAEGEGPEIAEQYRTKANELLTASGAKTIEKEEEETENE